MATRSVFTLFRERSLVAALLVALLSTAACSTKSAGKSEPGEQDLGSLSEGDLSTEASRFGSGNIPLPQAGEEGGPFADIPFDYDSFSVRPEYHDQLQEAARTLSADPSLRTEIEGHCDKRGTNEYNMALGQERAKAVASLLVSFGASADQISIVSYGEEIPLDPSDNEAAYAKNRRAHFALFRDRGGAAQGGSNQRY